MQRSECRTPSWLGGYAERRSISMMGHQNTKKMLLFHCFTACYVFDKGETLAFFRKNPCNPLRNERQNEI